MHWNDVSPFYEGDLTMWTRAFSAFLSIILLTAVCVYARPALAGSQPEGNAASSPDSHGGEAERGPLYVDRSLTFWSGALFVVLFIVLYFVAWGPISSGLDKREKNIADQIAQAAESHKQAKELLTGYEAKLAASAQEVRAILDKARQDAEAAAKEREAKAEADAKARLERAEKEIAAATSAATKELADRSAKLAVDLAGKIVRSKLNPKDHVQLIEQAISGFEISKQTGKFASRN